MKEIIAQLFYEIEKKNDTVLVTLIDDNGSAPRGAGSQMLINRNGRLMGTVGGGAVELRCQEMAQQLLQKRCSTVHDFWLHSNSKEDIGMVCGGDVTAQFQFIPADDPDWQELAAALAQRMEARQPGYFILREDGELPALVGDGTVLGGSVIVPELLSKLCGRGCLRMEGYFSMPLPIGQRAIIFGAGHVAQALCPVLSTVDFRPVIFDCRPELCTKELFPEAEEIVCGDFAHIAEKVTITPEDYLVVMTNGHSHDFEVECQVLRGEFAYLGVIGSRKKTASVNQRLLAAGIPQRALEKVHTPIGTNIKAVTPAEIAVSIAGEMIYVRAMARETQGELQHGCPMH